MHCCCAVCTVIAPHRKVIGNAVAPLFTWSGGPAAVRPGLLPPWYLAVSKGACSHHDFGHQLTEHRIRG